MKELSIEEKAHRYDEAIKEAVIAHKDEDKHLKATLERIFPELKEDEDERIRKELLEHCKNQAKPYIQTGNKCPQIQSWIDWLEKKGENSVCKVKIGETYKCIASPRYTCFFMGEIYHVTDNFVAELINMCSGCFVLLENQSEQNVIEPDDLIEESYQQQADDLIDMVTEKSAWDEEDERIYKAVLELIDSYSKGTIGGCIIPPNIGRYAKWFKALKDRVQLQPKQEWSEEDERYYNSIIEHLKYSITNGKPETYRGGCLTDWFKNLKNRYI